jgi:HEAT repeat protein
VKRLALLLPLLLPLLLAASALGLAHAQGSRDADLKQREADIDRIASRWMSFSLPQRRAAVADLASRALLDPASRVRKYALGALGRFGIDASLARSALVRLLSTSDDPDIYGPAAIRLSQVDSSDAKVLSLVRGRFVPAPRLKGDVLVAVALLRMKPSADPPRRALLAALEQGPSESIRTRAADELGLHWFAGHEPGEDRAPPGAESIVPGLRRALTQDASERVRWAALLALGRLGPAAAAAVEDLMGLYPDKRLRCLVVIGVGRIGAASRKHLPRILALWDALQEGKATRYDDPVVVLRALTNIAPDDTRVVAAAVEGIGNANSFVREQAARAVLRQTTKAGTELVLRLCREGGKPDVDAILLSGLGNRTPHSKEIHTLLLERSRHGDYPLRVAAIEGLGQSPERWRGAALKAITRCWTHDRQERVRRAALNALGELKAVERVGLLVKALEMKDFRGEAIEALRIIGPGAKAALPALDTLAGPKPKGSAENLYSMRERARAAAKEIRGR